MYARAEAKVKEMRQSVDLLKNETRKLEERARLAEEELQRGRTKLK
jgi:NADH:ubiquinone oxidoreductase subunit D